MASEKKYTERELRECQQLAYVQGWRDCWPTRDPLENAKRNYPLPRVTRPRVIQRHPFGTLFDWRLVGGVLEWRSPGGGSWGTYTIDSDEEWKRIGPIYADLLANPTEEVDDDGA